MTIAIGSIIFAALMILVTKAPVALAMAKASGGYDNRYPRDQQAQLQGFGKRAVGAHVNAIEAFPVFVAGVLVSLWTQAPIETISNLCLVFIAARCAYTISYWLNIHMLRSTTWTVGFVSSVWLMCLALP